jgi:hypothetical protein
VNSVGVQLFAERFFELAHGQQVLNVNRLHDRIDFTRLQSRVGVIGSAAHQLLMNGGITQIVSKESLFGPAAPSLVTASGSMEFSRRHVSPLVAARKYARTNLRRRSVHVK